MRCNGARRKQEHVMTKIELGQKLAEMMDDFWHRVVDEVRGHRQEADDRYEEIENELQNCILAGIARDIFIAAFEEVTENEV